MVEKLSGMYNLLNNTTNKIKLNKCKEISGQYRTAWSEMAVVLLVCLLMNRPNGGPSTNARTKQKVVKVFTIYISTTGIKHIISP